MKLENVKSVSDCERYCEGLINDFQSGIIERGQFMCGLRDYTFHLHDMFLNSLKTIIEKTDMRKLIIENFDKGDHEFEEFFNDDFFDLDEVNNIKVDHYPLGALRWCFNNLEKLKALAKKEEKI